MNSAQVNHYAKLADKIERDPYGPDGGGRAVVVNGRGWQRYKRFRGSGDLVTVTTLQGKLVELTRIQANVLDIARTKIDTGPTSMRDIAAEAGVHASTVYRALVKLSSYGLIAYITARGWKHGTMILRRGANDGLERFQERAKATVRKWAAATEARFARLRASVATYILEGGRRGDTLSDYFLVTEVATKTVAAWSPDELREVGII